MAARPLLTAAAALLVGAAAVPLATKHDAKHVLLTRGQDPAMAYSWYEKRAPSGACLADSERQSQLHQDQWALESTHCMRGGYYVDIGSNSGVTISNTYALDVRFGWRGLCADPFPHDMANRTCTVVEGVMWDVPGETVVFEQTHGDDGVFGSVVGVDSGREANITANAPTNVTFVTVTPRETFARHGVPAVLSLDVEGSELHVLRGIDYATHCFRNIALESNKVEPMRSEMRGLLEARGYAYVGSELFDDYYQSACAGSVSPHHP